MCKGMKHALSLPTLALSSCGAHCCARIEKIQKDQEEK
jgi:hypothetical protein